MGAANGQQDFEHAIYAHRLIPQPMLPLLTYSLLSQCYKHVCALLEKHILKAGKKNKVNVFYMISSICRQSKSLLREKDKYGESQDALIIMLIRFWD